MLSLSLCSDVTLYRTPNWEGICGANNSGQRCSRDRDRGLSFVSGDARSFGSANVDQTRATVGFPRSLSWKFYNIYICEEEEEEKEGQSRPLTCLFTSSPLPGIELFPPLVPAIGGRTRILWELIMLRAFSWETALAATIDCPLQHPRLHSTLRSSGL